MAGEAGCISLDRSGVQFSRDIGNLDSQVDRSDGTHVLRTGDFKDAEAITQFAIRLAQAEQGERQKFFDIMDGPLKDALRKAFKGFLTDPCFSNEKEFLANVHDILIYQLPERSCAVIGYVETSRSSYQLASGEDVFSQRSDYPFASTSSECVFPVRSLTANTWLSMGMFETLVAQDQPGEEASTMAMLTLQPYASLSLNNRPIPGEMKQEVRVSMRGKYSPNPLPGQQAAYGQIYGLYTLQDIGSTGRNVEAGVHWWDSQYSPDPSLTLGALDYAGTQAWIAASMPFGDTHQSATLDVLFSDFSQVTRTESSYSETGYVRGAFQRSSENAVLKMRGYAGNREGVYQNLAIDPVNMKGVFGSAEGVVELSKPGESARFGKLTGKGTLSARGDLNQGVGTFNGSYPSYQLGLTTNLFASKDGAEKELKWGASYAGDRIRLDQSRDKHALSTDIGFKYSRSGLQIAPALKGTYTQVAGYGEYRQWGFSSALAINYTPPKLSAVTMGASASVSQSTLEAPESDPVKTLEWSGLVFFRYRYPVKSRRE